MSAAAFSNGTKQYMPNKTDKQNSDNDKHRGVFRIAISDETFHFSTHEVADRKVTGAQIADIVKAHPVADFVVLEHLPS
jgi:hypothetical protein